MTGGPIAWLMAALAAAATIYYLAVLVSCRRFRRRRSDPERGARLCRAPGPVARASEAQPRLQGEALRHKAPPVSVLKPVRGLDPNFEDNLRAHLVQDYPEFEVLVGVADADDPARAIAERLGCPVVVCGESDGGNRKVAILERLAARASHSLLLVDDADIRPPRGWLAETAAALEQPGVGLATCLYRARPGRTLGSNIDALWVSADFAGQALTGAELAGVPFALGATMAFRREDLEAIGGFETLRPYLADDFQLGARMAAQGKRVALSPSVVETAAGDVSLRETWRRHVRWSRTVRVSRPGGHFGLIATFGTPWSLALLGLGAWPWLAGGCLLARGVAATTAARTVGAQLGSAWLLLPAADLWAFAVWVASYFGRTVVWRGRELRLDRKGRIS